MLRIVVLISGSGSNLQAIIDAAQQDLPIEIAAVISSREDALGLQRAKSAGIKTHFLDPAEFQDRHQYDAALVEIIESYRPQLVVLAGFMRILSEEFVTHYVDRLLNIHPSLLPKYKGLNTHQRALESDESVHGASVHLVTYELDNGPVIVQTRVPVLAGDSVESLAKRVLKQEHRIYPLALRWIAQGRLAIKGNQLFLDGSHLLTPVVV